MIYGIGTDIVEIARIRRALERWGDRFLNRVFTQEEIQYALGRRDPAPHLAGRFAAKEAAAKALGTGIARGVAWRQIFVTRRRGQPPRINFSGRAAELLAEFGPDAQAHLSITHSRELAQAVVILEK